MPPDLRLSSLMDRMLGRLLLLAGGLVVIGSLLPWHIVKGLGVDLNIDGIDSPNNGVVTLVLGLVLAVLGFRMIDASARPRRVVLGVAVLTLGVTIWALLDASNADEDLEVKGASAAVAAAIDLERAYGQWVLLAGTVLTLVVALLLNRGGAVTAPASADSI